MLIFILLMRGHPLKHVHRCEISQEKKDAKLITETHVDNICTDILLE